MGTKKLIDLTYIKSLSNGSDQFVEKMVTLVLEQMPEAVSNLEKYFQAKDWKALRSTAHKLKASFMFIGVKELPEMVESVEVYAANEVKLDLLPDIIFKIKDLSGRIMKELEMEQKSLG